MIVCIVGVVDKKSRQKRIRKKCMYSLIKFNDTIKTIKHPKAHIHTTIIYDINKKNKIEYNKIQQNTVYTILLAQTEQTKQYLYKRNYHSPIQN